LLYGVAFLQAAAGALISGSCLCAPDFRRVGALVAVGMAVTVTAFCLLGVWARTRARHAVMAGVLLEAVVLAAMGLPSIAAGTPAWAAQVPIMVLLVVAAVVALK
jgi:hypothetical protein